jgi:hypothetical protein
VRTIIVMVAQHVDGMTRAGVEGVQQRLETPLGIGESPS